MKTQGISGTARASREWSVRFIKFKAKIFWRVDFNTRVRGGRTIAIIGPYSGLWIRWIFIRIYAILFISK